MKRYFLLGGFIGFAIAFTGSFASAANLNMALRDGMLGCLVMAFGFRFIYRQLELGALHILRTEEQMMRDAGPQVNGKHAHKLNSEEGSKNEE